MFDIKLTIHDFNYLLFVSINLLLYQKLLKKKIQSKKNESKYRGLKHAVRRLTCGPHVARMSYKKKKKLQFTRYFHSDF